MAIVTINGQRGSGAPEIGMEVASRLGYTYLDRQVLGEAANRLGTTPEALEHKESTVSSGPRVLTALTRIVNRMGASGALGDPFSPFGLDQDYRELLAGRGAEGHHIDDKQFLEATVEVIRDLAESGEVVIVGRAGNIILREHPQALHVGLVSEQESRAGVVAQREGITPEEAKLLMDGAEQARLEYFRRYFNTDADDPMSFHLMLNTHLLARQRIVEIIAGSIP